MDITGTLTKADSSRFPSILCQVSCVPKYSTVSIPSPEKTLPSSALPSRMGEVTLQNADGQKAAAQVTPTSAGAFYLQGSEALKSYLMAAEQNLPSLALRAAFQLSEKASS